MAVQAQHGPRLRDRKNVIAVGVGVAYREHGGRFADSRASGERAPLALKVIVRRKFRNVPRRDRVPRTVSIRVDDAGRPRYHRMPVDVVVEGRPVSGTWLADGDAVEQGDYPHTGFAALGHRLFVGYADDSVDSAPSPLAPGYRWDIGTVGAVVTNGQQRYVMTAGHVLRDPYLEGATFPEHCRVGFDVDDPGLHADNLQPTVPRMPRDGVHVIDIVGLPLTAAQAERSETETLAVAAPEDFADFHGQAALLRVERNDAIIELPGTVEGYFEEYGTKKDGVAVRLGPTVLIRCGGLLPADGDSGAPVLARHPNNKALTLLGFHIGRTDGLSTAAPLAYAMAAWPALAHTRLGLA